MKSKHTYGDITHALKSCGVEATEQRIGELDRLSFEYPDMELPMVVFKHTQWIEESVNKVHTLIPDIIEPLGLASELNPKTTK